MSVDKYLTFKRSTCIELYFRINVLIKALFESINTHTHLNNAQWMKINKKYLEELYPL